MSKKENINSNANYESMEKMKICNSEKIMK